LDRDQALRKAADAGSPTFVCVVLEDRDGELAGYAWYRWQAGADRSGFGICARRDRQGSGGGTALMTALLAVAAEYGPPIMTLTVQKANPRAVALYGKMGFRVVREHLRASDQEPEYAMERPCVPSSHH
jgi:ribosomal protein S18 acetylase RimI-like enzyme